MLYLGIDIGKQKHVAALLSVELLARHKRFDACPTLAIGNVRAGFEQLLAAIRIHADPSECYVLTERTGHYGQALETYLQEAGCHLYTIAAQQHYANNKSDQRDARALATLLYNEVYLHAPIVDEKRRIRLNATPSPHARTLLGLVHHRYELVSESTQRKNKLTALIDETFPEFTQIYRDPFTPSALALREQFPTPGAIAAADIADLCATRKRNQPSRAQLLELQTLAATTIGNRDASRLSSLLLEQRMLIAELRLMSAHIDELEAAAEALLADCREGQILMSLPGIASVQAAKLVAGISTIANFESDSKLRGYLGWAPQSSQTGTSKDSSTLSKGGNPMLKQAMYLVAMTAIRTDPWKSTYERMLARKCNWDGRKKDYEGKMKVVGHIIGKLITVMYVLLRRDYDLLASLPPGQKPPAPELYNPARHRATSEKAGGERH